MLRPTEREGRGAAITPPKGPREQLRVTMGGGYCGVNGLDACLLAGFFERASKNQPLIVVVFNNLVVHVVQGSV
jgi:hypothetical protein